MPTPELPALSPAVASSIRLMLQQKDRDWLLLRTFYLVAEHGSYYAAAKLLGLAEPSSVWKRIERLQVALGNIALVSPGDRTGTPLTDLGWAVVSMIQPEFDTRST